MQQTETGAYKQQSQIPRKIEMRPADGASKNHLFAGCAYDTL
jgi:hypothetical protein